MDSMSIRVLGDEELLQRIRRKSSAWKRRFLDAARKASVIVSNELKRNYSAGPLYSRSGNLYRSVREFLDFDGLNVTGGAGTPVFYAEVLEGGKYIEGRPWLRFQTQDGKWISVRSVQIPAFKAAEKAAEQAEPEVRQIYERTVQRFVEG
jgi:hypothetical protein